MSSDIENNPLDKSAQLLASRQRQIASRLFRAAPGADMRTELWGDRKPRGKKARSDYGVAVKVETVEFELWRAGRRFQLGSYAALLDTLSICEDNKWPLPRWVSAAMLTDFSKIFSNNADFHKKHRRMKQSESVRLTQQKHVQLFQTIGLCKNAIEPPPKMLENLLLEVPEREFLSDNELDKANNVSSKIKLVCRVLRKAESPFAASESTIERNLSKIRKRVRTQFDCASLAEDKPALYLWDISFVRISTIRSLLI